MTDEAPTAPSGPGTAPGEAEIPMDDVRIVWAQDSYDGVPLSGHAWHAGRYCYFAGGHYEAVPDPADPTRERYEASWTLHELSGQDLVMELAARKLFEDMVGYHWTTFPAGPGKAGPGRELSFTGGVTDDWKAYYENPLWTPFSKRVLDVGGLARIGTFRDRGDWRPVEVRGAEPEDGDGA